MNISIYVDDRKGSQINTTTLFVLDLNYCYQQKSKNKIRPLSVIHALDFTFVIHLFRLKYLKHEQICPKKVIILVGALFV